MVIIGITGTLGAGKGTVVDYLVKEKNFQHYSVRGYLAEIIKSREGIVDRDSLTHTANELRKQFNPAYIIDQLYKVASTSGENCVIESIRTPGEISSLRKYDNFYLLAVDADIKTRFQRIKHRNSETDHIDFDTFKNNETREMHSDDPNKQNLSECIRQADFVIDNNGTIDELNTNTERIISQIIKNQQ
jgi:dephospho-CoA kinase